MYMADSRELLIRISRHFDEQSVRGVEKFFDHLRDFLNGLLDPGSVGELREASLLEETDREWIMRLHDALMHARRRADLALLRGGEDDALLSIYAAFWEEHGEQVQRVYELLVRLWDERREEYARTDYVG